MFICTLLLRDLIANKGHKLSKSDLNWEDKANVFNAINRIQNNTHDKLYIQYRK